MLNSRTQKPPYHDSFIQHVTHYQINIDRDDYNRLMSIIRNNVSVTPEMVGMILGTAKAQWLVDYCSLCHQPMKKGEEVGYDYDNGGWYHTDCLTNVDNATEVPA